MLIDITNFNFECDDKGGSFLIDFNFACDCKNSGDTETYNLELDLTDYGYGYGKFKLNNTTYSANTTPYKLNFTDELTSFSLMNSNVTRIISFPNTSKVKSLNSVFAYAPITNLNVKDWDLSGVEEINFAFSYLQKCFRINFNTDILKGKTSAQGLFGGCKLLETVNTNVIVDGVILGESTSGITNASYMFYDCNKIQSVTMVANHITNTSHMFDGCSSLTKINGGVWKDVTDASYMFANCSSLDMNLFETNSVLWQNLIKGNCTNMRGMFNGCNFGNSDINFPNTWYVHYVTDMSYLFANSSLGDFSRPSNWDWFRCSNFSHMFEGNPMNSISLNDADWASATDFSYMFKDCWNLNSVNFENAYNLTGVTNVEGMFEGCTNLQVVYCSDCDTYNIIKQGLESSGLDSSIIQGCDCGDNSGGNRSDRFIIQSPINSLCEFAVNDNWIAFNENNEEISFFDKTLDDFKNEYGYGVNSVTFYGDVGNILDLPYTDTLTEITISSNGEIEYLDLSRTNLNALTNLDLRNLNSLVHLDLSNWQTVNIPYDIQSWTNIPNLKTIKMLNCSSDAISFVQEKLGDGDYIIITEDNNTYITVKANSSSSEAFFDGSMQPLRVPVTDINDWGYSSFDGKYVDYMFESNTDVTSVFNLPSLSGTTRHKSMFLDATNIKYLDCRKFDFNWTSDDQDIQDMFYYCSSVKWLNLSSWDLTNAYNYESMFNNCSELKYVFAYGCNEDTIGKLNSAIDNSGYSINLLY